MRALLGRSEGEAETTPVERFDATRSNLPFREYATALGTVCRRFQRLGASHHVGRIPVDAAASAEPEMLGLLSLDPALARCSPAGALFFDTETTGLGGASGVLAFLVGLAWFDEEGRLCVEQVLLRSPAEESAMLGHLAERLDAASFWVTFNGKAFDWPLLRTRYVMNRMPAPAQRPHLDLLHVSRRLHRARVGRCRLVDVEGEVLGFERCGDIAGAEVAARYAHFLRTGDESSLTAVVDHNAWDVVSMAALVGLYGEPLGVLHPEDLVELARALKRAGAAERALAAADRAISSGARAGGLRMRALLAKARGDRLKALEDFEALSAELDDPHTRLELAKLYEHHARRPLEALEMVRRGTSETAERSRLRELRLERKLARQARAKPKRP